MNYRQLIVIAFVFTAFMHSSWTQADETSVNSSGIDGLVNQFSGKNSAPVADAGIDQTESEAVEVVHLSGSGSTDPDTSGGQSDIVTYQWVQVSGPNVVLIDSTSQNASFVPPNVGEEGATLVFMLTITDSGGLQSTDSVEIFIFWDRDPPIANAGSDQSINEGMIVTLDGSASTDPNGTVSSYHWTQTSGSVVLLSDTTSPTPFFTAPDVGSTGDVLVFTLTVTDNEDYESSDAVNININWVNSVPVADAGQDQVAEEGETVTLFANNSYDNDDGIASYLWEQQSGTIVTLSDNTFATPTFVYGQLGSTSEVLTFQLTITDKNAAQSTDSVDISIIDNGITIFGSDITSFMSSTDKPMGIKTENENSTIVALNPMDETEITVATGRPENLIYGLLEFCIKLTNSGDKASILIYFPETIAESYQLYSTSNTQGWSVIKSNISFSSDRKSVKIEITDGYLNDGDGKIDSKIQSIFAFGTEKITSSTTPQTTVISDDDIVDGPPLKTGDLGGDAGCIVSTISK